MTFVFTWRLSFEEESVMYIVYVVEDKIDNRKW